LSVSNLARVIKFTRLGPSVLLPEVPTILVTVLVVVEDSGGGATVVGGALEDVVGGAVDDSGGGAFVLVVVVVGDVGVVTFSPPGEGNEASWVGRILLGVFPLDCLGSVAVSTLDGDGVPFSSASLTFCPSFPVAILFGVSFRGSACFFSD
jgi:hypothetical protein